MSAVEWRTCGACGDHFEGEYGGCPRCQKAHTKKQPPVMSDGQRKRGRPTLDIQEGNDDL